MPEIRYYVASDGGSPFEVWFSDLDVTARAKMTVAIARMGTLIILLTGGTKKRQQRDIETAAGFWRDYKRTKRSVRKERGER